MNQFGSFISSYYSMLYLMLYPCYFHSPVWMNPSIPCPPVPTDIKALGAASVPALNICEVQGRVRVIFKSVILVHGTWDKCRVYGKHGNDVHSLLYYMLLTYVVLWHSNPYVGEVGVSQGHPSEPSIGSPGTISWMGAHFLDIIK